MKPALKKEIETTFFFVDDEADKFLSLMIIAVKC